MSAEFSRGDEKCRSQFAVWNVAMFALKNIKSIKYNNSI